MQVTSIDKRDVLAGVFFLVAGVFSSVLAIHEYVLGSAMRMGPGYFPLLLGVTLGLLGVVLVARSLRRRVVAVGEGWRFGTLAWRPALFVVAGMLAFALLAQHQGLLLAIVVLTVLSGLARPGVRVSELLVLSLVLAAFGVAVFSYGLGLPLPILPD